MRTMPRDPIKCPTCKGPVGIPRKGLEPSPSRALTVVYSSFSKKESSASAYGCCSRSYFERLRIEAVTQARRSRRQLTRVKASLSLLLILTLAASFSSSMRAFSSSRALLWRACLMSGKGMASDADCFFGSTSGTGKMGLWSATSGVSSRIESPWKMRLHQKTMRQV